MRCCRLNRFLTAKKEDARGPREKRPYLATECHNLHEADKWRYQVSTEQVAGWPAHMQSVQACVVESSG